MTSSNESDPTRVPIGLDALRAWVELRFTVVENPHILVVGGSQVGKTTLQLLIAAVAASRGNIVVILDPKLRFARAFRHPRTREPLPNVLVYRDPDPYIAAREWQGILDLLVAEMQSRYQADDQANADILADQRKFPTVLVVADELGNLLDFADKEWPYRKPEGHKGDAPVRDALHTLTRMGAENRIIGCFANQTASEKEMPAGTRTRQLCGQRIFLGPIKEGSQWRMLAGEGTDAPDIPGNQKGAGAVIFGDAKPLRFQAAFVDWKNHPEKLYRIAAQGVSILQEHGHLDAAGRLRLAGVTVPPPGQMASHVTSRRIDLLPDITPGSDDSSKQQKSSGSTSPKMNNDQEASRNETGTVPRDVPIIGLQDGAAYCGMSYANFRKVRELYPIDGEIDNAKGNKPGWQEADLRTWALRHGQPRRSTDSQERGA